MQKSVLQNCCVHTLNDEKRKKQPGKSNAYNVLCWGNNDKVNLTSTLGPGADFLHLGVGSLWLVLPSQMPDSGVWSSSLPVEGGL